MSKRHVKTFVMRKVVFTLNIPDIDKVKLDVNVTTKNSLASRKKAINAPSTIQIHFKISQKINLQIFTLKMCLILKTYVIKKDFKVFYTKEFIRRNYRHSLNICSQW